MKNKTLKLEQRIARLNARIRANTKQPLTARERAALVRYMREQDKYARAC